MPQAERLPEADTGAETGKDGRKTLPAVPSPELLERARRPATREIRKRVEVADTAALARAQEQLDHTKWKSDDEATEAIEEAIDVINHPEQHAKTQPMMPVVEQRATEGQLTELDRALAEAKGMEQRLQDAGIDPDALAAGKVGLWRRLTHSQLIHDWTEANKAVAELGAKGGVDRRAEQSAGRRARIVPPKAPRSPLGLG